MNSRQKILDAIRAQAVPPTELPELTGPYVDYPDPVEQFANVLNGIGGQCRHANDLADVRRQLDSQGALAGDRRIVSLFEEVESNLNQQTIEHPRELHGLDLAVLPGEVAVAENGSVWVNGQSVRHRAIYFLAEHLVLVVPRQQVVAHMHDAYRWLDQHRPAWRQTAFGCFISGPSKTADIEQSLVIGAQGPRAHTVFLLRG